MITNNGKDIDMPPITDPQFIKKSCNWCLGRGTYNTIVTVPEDQQYKPPLFEPSLSKRGDMRREKLASAKVLERMSKGTYVFTNTVVNVCACTIRRYTRHRNMLIKESENKTK